MRKQFRNRRLAAGTKPEEILAGHTREVCTMAERLRRIVLETVPDAVEAAYPVWHGSGYRHPESSCFCGIFPQKNAVKLGFEHASRINLQLGVGCTNTNRKSVEIGTHPIFGGAINWDVSLFFLYFFFG